MKMLLMLAACVPVALAQFAKAPAQSAGFMPPKLVNKLEVDYTAEAHSKGIEGDSTLFTEIGKDGVPVNIKVIKPLDPALDAKAVESLKQWRFRPAEKDGTPVSATATVVFRFRIKKFDTFPELRTVPDPPMEDDVLWFFRLPARVF